MTTTTRGYGFASVARMEWIKLGSLRSSWGLAVGSVLAMVVVGAAVGIGYRGYTPVATGPQIVNNSLAGAVLAQLLLGALGLLAVTAEYGSGAIRPTFAAVPRRGLVLAAKATVYGLTALAVALAASVAGFLAGQLAIAGTPIPRASLADPAILRAVILTALYLGAASLIGVGLGALIRHTGGAIGALFGGLFVSMVVAGLLGPGAAEVTRFVPMIMLVNSIAVVEPMDGLLSPWAGVGVMVLYAAVALAAGGLLLARRDA